MKIRKTQQILKSERLVLAGALLLIMTMASGPVVSGPVVSGPGAAPKVGTALSEKVKVCNTIEDQIAAAQALEDYAQARYEGHDEWDEDEYEDACEKTSAAYKSACNARVDLQQLSDYFCDSSVISSPCVAYCIGN